MDFIGAIVEEVVPPISAGIYFVSGVYTEYETHQINENRAWPKSWGVK